MHLQRRFLSKVSAWLSPNAESDVAIRTFGATDERIVRSLFPFDLVEGSDEPSATRARASKIVFYGSARPEKGVGLLPELLRRTRGIHYEFYFPNDGSYAEMAREDPFGRNHVSIQVGQPWRPAVREATCRSRAVLLPSIYPSCGEISFYNAMALGKAIAGFRVGANESLLGEGADGCLVPLGDLSRLAALVSRLHDDEGYAHELGERNRARARQLFDPQALWSTYHQAYDRALEEISRN